MVEEIYELKNKILAQVEKETMNMDRIDVKEVGELVDMVKDLAEAEKSCWEASYYRKVTESMDGASGYTPANMGGGTGSSARAGYGSTARMGYMASSGHTEVMEPLRTALQAAGPDEREHMRNEVLKMIGAM